MSTTAVKKYRVNMPPHLADMFVGVLHDGDVCEKAYDHDMVGTPGIALKPPPGRQAGHRDGTTRMMAKYLEEVTDDTTSDATPTKLATGTPVRVKEDSTPARLGYHVSGTSYTFDRYVESHSGVPGVLLRPDRDIMHSRPDGTMWFKEKDIEACGEAPAATTPAATKSPAAPAKRTYRVEITPIAEALVTTLTGLKTGDVVTEYREDPKRPGGLMCRGTSAEIPEIWIPHEWLREVGNETPAPARLGPLNLAVGDECEVIGPDVLGDNGSDGKRVCIKTSPMVQTHFNDQDGTPGYATDGGDPDTPFALWFPATSLRKVGA